jgi:LysR family transcriptional regulator, transcriptional activator of nhaA
MHLNFHHLRYFHAIAREGSLTRAARQLNLSQSALSVQLKKLEEALGHALFDREHKSLVLTEAGKMTLDHAESIFRLGDDLMDTLQHRRADRRRVLRVGAVATLSRNFQMRLLADMALREDVELVLRSGSLAELLGQLQSHTVDLVLSNQAVRRDADRNWFSHRLAEQPVSLVAGRMKRRKAFRFPEDLEGIPVLLPSLESSIRTAFDLMMERHGVRPVIAAEVDDMAMLRLMARESGTLALVPRVVVRDELEDGVLVERYRFPEIREGFYAITPSRKFPNGLVKELVEHGLKMQFDA